MTKTLYVTDKKLWTAIKIRARREDISLSKLVEKVMREYLRPDLGRVFDTIA